jgi:hypothetical protein
MTEIIRQKVLTEQIVIIDGQPGCGKSMLSAIISSLDRVELRAYPFEVEWICRLFSLKKIDNDAAKTMIKMLVDLKLYQTMMGRDVNFRCSDLSSAFRDANPWRYFKRIFQEGDVVIPQRIKDERPILNLTTHNLLYICEPVISAFGSKAVFVEVVRHPLYMIKQQYLNMQRLVNNPRDIAMYVDYNGKQLPYYAVGWEQKFLDSNDMEKAIFAMAEIDQLGKEKRKLWVEGAQPLTITIPFEKFVIDPLPYMERIAVLLDTKTTKRTCKVMRKQNVPRSQPADAPNFASYKKCGWVPPSGVSEQEELNSRREFVAEKASTEALAIIDALSEEYEAKYLHI